MAFFSFRQAGGNSFSCNNQLSRGSNRKKCDLDNSADGIEFSIIGVSVQGTDELEIKEKDIEGMVIGVKVRCDQLDPNTGEPAGDTDIVGKYFSNHTSRDVMIRSGVEVIAITGA